MTSYCYPLLCMLARCGPCAMTPCALRYLLLSSLLAAPLAVLPQNPISPHGVYFADPSARTMGDTAVYLYGSVDEDCEKYCSTGYHVLQSNDMKHWALHKDVFSTTGPNDEVHYNDKVLYAPDALCLGDSCYLYYCQPDRNNAEGVAVGTSPAGPFIKGKPIDTNGFPQIDPAVFVDDDGSTWYLWGQFTLKMARLNPDMRSIDPSTLRDSVLTEGAHHFHEGAYLTKREGLYYMVYTDISRGDIPTCIGYATSTHPQGPYNYRGVIIDNNHCNPGNWNNHGSIAALSGQWYVFYHRSTHGCNTMRKACAEPISFTADGSIPEVEMTTQGTLPPLSATSTTEAEWACVLHGHARVERIGPQEEALRQMKSGDKAAYKYLDFGTGTDSLSLRYRAPLGGTLIAAADKLWHQRLLRADLPATPADEWRIITLPVNAPQGIHAFWLMYHHEGDGMMDIDWFRFE